MNIALDSPMEAIAINYLKNQAFLTTVWAWIAFLTAAISFSWKIKSSIHSSVLPPHHHHHHLSFTSSSSSSSSSTSNDQPKQLDDDEVPSTTFCRLENRRSGKFSLHYDNINNIENQQYLLGTFRSHQQDEEKREMGLDYDYDYDYDDDDDDDEMMMMGGTGSIKHVGYWEGDDVVLMKMKIREMGWYCYQDLSLLDGNVVRLWNKHSHVNMNGDE